MAGKWPLSARSGTRRIVNRRLRLMRRRGCGQEADEPAFTLIAGTARQRHLQVELCNVPLTGSPVRDELDDMRFQEIFGRVMAPMLVLDAPEQRELPSGSQVQLERRQPRPFAVIDALG